MVLYARYTLFCSRSENLITPYVYYEDTSI
jgi:hypothetical protein